MFPVLMLNEFALEIPEFAELKVDQARCFWKECCSENWLPRIIRLLTTGSLPMAVVLLGDYEPVWVVLGMLVGFVLGEYIEVVLMRPHVRRRLEAEQFKEKFSLNR